jgi:hypothetical protein
VQPANFSISPDSSMKGNCRSSASLRPSVDLPPPRRPISAMRGLYDVPAVAALQQLADKQPLGRRGRHVAEQFGQRALQRLGHVEQHQDRRVADAVLQIGQVPLRHVGGNGHLLARHAAA